MLKLILYSVIFFGLIYFGLDNMSGKNLAQSYCHGKAKNETQRVYNSGFAFRDKETESENTQLCLDSLEGASLAKVLVEYGKDLLPNEESEK